MKVLRLEDIGLRIEGKRILENVSWTIKSGENWALIGENGSGKTTLLRIVTGYLWPSRGDVWVFGKHFGGIDLRELRKSIGFVSSVMHDRMPGNETVLNVVLSGGYATIGLWDKASATEGKRAKRLISFMDCKGLECRRFGTLSQASSRGF